MATAEDAAETGVWENLCYAWRELNRICSVTFSEAGGADRAEETTELKSPVGGAPSGVSLLINMDYPGELASC